MRPPPRSLPAALAATRHRVASWWRPYTFVTGRGPGYASGFGNKLFVLATAAGYALTHGYELVVEDTPGWGSSVTGADHEAGKQFKAAHLPDSMRQLFPSLRFEPGWFVHSRLASEISDQGVNYDRGECPALRRQRNAAFTGYFLTTASFHHQRSEILQRLRFAPAVDDYVDATYGDWLRLNPIGVHVRRGDRATNNLEPLLSYYTRALACFPPAAAVTVISDDPVFCREVLFADLLQNRRVLYVTNERHYVDLVVFSRCAGHVLANSTFSFWGAYRSSNFADKQIVCPKDCWLSFPNWQKI
ncbi:MAG: alpha-1,2-fucosyltransferase [Opitutaceae bacterium]|nr:alpha-1,2-fucosyltransferase [Opitutaceae bacterium]